MCIKLKIDKSDLVLLNKSAWTIQHSRGGKYYVKRSRKRDGPGKYLKGYEIYLHRLIARCPKGMTVDHINGDTLDNRKSNLRVCSQANNVCNQSKHKDGITSKYKGVHIHTQNGKWTAQVQYRGKKKYLGLFKTEVEAALARDRAAKELHGQYASLNFPEKEG